jgi:hypothetical protein
VTSMFISILLSMISRNILPIRDTRGLPRGQRRHFLIMFDYMSSMACLVSFEIVTINHVFAMYGFLFQDLWSQMRPFVEREREPTGREIGFVVEDLRQALAGALRGCGPESSNKRSSGSRGRAPRMIGPRMCRSSRKNVTPG